MADMEKSEVRAGRTYVTASGARHFVVEVSGQKVTFEIADESRQRPGALIESNLGRFAIQHEPA